MDRLFLGRGSEALVWMEGKSDHRDSRYGGSMAPGRLPNLLGMDFSRMEVCWQEANFQRGTKPNSPHGRRKFNLWCASNSWGAPPARV